MNSVVFEAVRSPAAPAKFLLATEISVHVSLEHTIRVILFMVQFGRAVADLADCKLQFMSGREADRFVCCGLLSSSHCTIDTP